MSKSKNTLDKAVIKKIIKYCSRYSFLMFLAIFMSIASVIATLFGPILIGKAIDLLIGVDQVDFEKLREIIMYFGICIMVVAITQLISNLAVNRVSCKVAMDMRIEGFAHINKLPISYIDSSKHGDIVSKLVNDVNTFSDGLYVFLAQFFSSLATIVCTIIFMMILDFRIAIFVVIVTPASLLTSSFIAKKTYKYFRKQSEANGEMTDFVNELVGRQKLVKEFTYEDKAIERFEVLNDNLEETSFKATFYSSTVNPTTRFMNNMIYAIVGVVGALRAIKGLISIGDVTAFLGYANSYTKPFNDLSNVITEIENSLACAGRVFDLLEEEVTVDDGTKELVNEEHTITFKDVCFSYEEDKPLIENFNLTAPPGTKVAIVGRTGSGKSTLINLLMRFYEIKGGAILFDDKDIRDIKKADLRKNFGMVLQETWLKEGTVAENIAYGKENVTREEIIAAAKLTHADRFINRLPDGYDTYISEAGTELSEGEKQLLCITRVFLLEPKMLILDEATSGVDLRTEIRIKRATEKLTKGKTSFVVAHRLSTIKESDIILVIDKGHVVEQGTHEELVANHGLYYDMYHELVAESI